MCIIPIPKGKREDIETVGCSETTTQSSGQVLRSMFNQLSQSTFYYNRVRVTIQNKGSRKFVCKTRKQLFTRSESTVNNPQSQIKVC